MSMQAERVGDFLKVVRQDAPQVGLAALAGKSPNESLRNAWRELNGIGVTLQKSGMGYRWRALHDLNPKLAHGIEEVLVFGEALFAAWGKRQSPEGLKDEYIDLKQRFSKIIKETEGIAQPKEEKKMFAFFGGGAGQTEVKTELRLKQLDELLEEAHSKSRRLLGKTEKDLLEERAFHKAAEWYVLALQKASQHIQEVVAQGEASGEMISDLQTALQVSTATSSVILATTDQWLRVKEALHNKSITFLTAHENTFTIIQGHLRSWKDIKNQTEALDALNQAVKMGSQLMSVASTGVEQPMNQWNPSIITPEALQNLSASFNDYDKDVSALVADLVSPKSGATTGAQFSRWDDWAQTKKDLVDPILAQVDAPTAATAPERLRPTLRKMSANVEDAPSASAPVATLSAALVEANISLPTVVRPLRGGTSSQWNRIEKMVAGRTFAVFQKYVGGVWDADRAERLGWSPQDVSERLSLPLRAIGESKVKDLPASIRSEIDALVTSPSAHTLDWEAIGNQVALPFDKKWEERFGPWMKSKDDLDWSYLMQWNELVYDLLILDSDREQKSQLFAPEGKAMRQSIQERLEEFFDAPNIDQKSLREWGFAGLMVRYGMALELPAEKVQKGWSLFTNTQQPLDWDDQPVSTWADRYPADVSTQTGQALMAQIDQSIAPIGGVVGEVQAPSPLSVEDLKSKATNNDKSRKPSRARIF